MDSFKKNDSLSLRVDFIWVNFFFFFFFGIEQVESESRFLQPWLTSQAAHFNYEEFLIVEASRIRFRSCSLFAVNSELWGH